MLIKGVDLLKMKPRQVFLALILLSFLFLYLFSAAGCMLNRMPATG